MEILPYANDKNSFYTQNNNSIEAMVDSLETCGASAGVNIVASLLGEKEIDIYRTQGGERLQPEDIFTLILHIQR